MISLTEAVERLLRAHANPEERAVYIGVLGAVQEENKKLKDEIEELRNQNTTMDYALIMVTKSHTLPQAIATADAALSATSGESEGK